jgi:hypothetical protein
MESCEGEKSMLQPVPQAWKVNDVEEQSSHSQHSHNSTESNHPDGDKEVETPVSTDVAPDGGYVAWSQVLAVHFVSPRSHASV